MKKAIAMLLVLVFCFTSGRTVAVLAEGLDAPPVSESPQTESSAEPSSEPATEPPTESSSEPATELPTESSSEPVTEPPTESSSEPATEPPTEPSSEPVTEPSSSAEDTSGKNPVRVMGCSISEGAVLKSLHVITITFSNNVVNASVAENNRSKIKILDAGGGRVPSAVSMADDQVQSDLRRIITISPTSALEDGNYRLVVKAGVKAKNGTSTPDDYVVHFTIRGSGTEESGEETPMQPEEETPAAPEERTSTEAQTPTEPEESLEDHGDSGEGSGGSGEDAFGNDSSSGDLSGNDSSEDTFGNNGSEAASGTEDNKGDSQGSIFGENTPAQMGKNQPENVFEGFAANQDTAGFVGIPSPYENLTPEMLALASITTPKEKESEAEETEAATETTEESAEAEESEDEETAEALTLEEENEEAGQASLKAPVLRVYQLSLNSAPGYLTEWKEESFDFMLTQVTQTTDTGNSLEKYVILAGILLLGAGAGGRYWYFRKQLSKKQEIKE